MDSGRLLPLPTTADSEISETKNPNHELIHCNLPILPISKEYRISSTRGTNTTTMKNKKKKYIISYDTIFPPTTTNINISI